MIYLSSAPFPNIVALSSLFLGEAQRVACHALKDSFKGSSIFVSITELDCGLTQVLFESTIPLTKNVVDSLHDKVTPLLKDDQVCRLFAVCHDIGEQVNIIDVVLNNKGVIDPADADDSLYAENHIIADLSDISEIAESDLLKIHELSGGQWKRSDVVCDYIATSSFKISDKNQRKLTKAIKACDWGEFDLPTINFVAGETISISGICSDHGILNKTVKGVNQDRGDTVELSDLIKMFAMPNQSISTLTISQCRLATYTIEKQIVTGAVINQEAA